MKKPMVCCQVYSRMLQQGDLARGSLGYGQHRFVPQKWGPSAGRWGKIGET